MASGGHESLEEERRVALGDELTVVVELACELVEVEETAQVAGVVDEGRHEEEEVVLLAVGRAVVPRCGRGVRRASVIGPPNQWSRIVVSAREDVPRRGEDAFEEAG